MKRKLPLILLLISLAFNVFGVVGFICAKARMARMHSPEGRARYIAKKLDLDEGQMTAFDGLLARYLELREERAPQRDEFLDEMLKDEPDRPALVELMTGEQADKHRLARLDLMLEFFDLLRPEQRQKFVEMMKKYRSGSK